MQAARSATRTCGACRVGLRVDGERRDAELPAGARDAHRDLAAIGDQDPFEHEVSLAAHRRPQPLWPPRAHGDAIEHRSALRRPGAASAVCEAPRLLTSGTLRRGSPGSARCAAAARASPSTSRVSHGSSDAVVPQARGRVVRAAFVLVLGPDRRDELRLAPPPIMRLLLGGQLLELDGQQRARGLLAAHHRDARVRPHEEQARAVGAAAHAVVAGAVRGADDHGELRHRGGGDRVHHLRAVLGDAAVLVALADDEAGDVLQEEQRDPSLARTAR